MTGFPPHVRQIVRDRATETVLDLFCDGSIGPNVRPMCEVAVECDGGDWQLHHRLPRRMGGSKRPEVNGAANSLAVCASCHRHIESQRETAYANGWLLRQNDIPAQVPVLRRGVWVLLDDAGSVFVCPEGYVA